MKNGRVMLLIANLSISQNRKQLYFNMDDIELEEHEKGSNRRLMNRSQIVSIRKNLTAPNDLLPGSMLKSQLPIHLLPVRQDFQSKAGHQMLLDSTEDDSPSTPTLKYKTYRPKNIKSKTIKTRSKSQISQNRVSQGVHPFQPVGQICQKSIEKDCLDFLGQNVRNIINYPQNLVFVSKSALISNVRLNPCVQKWGTQKKKEETNKIYHKNLKQMQYFATVPYAFDQFKQQKIFLLQSYINEKDDLQFDDNFQSSNLFTATHANKTLLNQNIPQQSNKLETYMLTVRLDYNTKSYGQWFYFKVKRRAQLYSFNRSSGNLYKFMIINMTKSSSMFGRGLKLSVCRNGQWRKEGINIKYYRNSLKRDEHDGNNNPMINTLQPVSYYSTLQFTLQIYQGQQIFISYNQPYTFSRVGKLLDKVTTLYEQNRRNIIEIKRHIICSTYLSNNIEVLNFTATNSMEDSNQQKKVIFIVSRCHPVETAGSHVIEGIITTLCSLFIESPIEEQKNHMIYKLLEHYVIKVIPMLNPDGVILGNSRCNIAGYDLNRSWKAPKPDRCKEIYAIKHYILGFQSRIAMFIDLHAHSKKKNVFAYGCHDTSDPFSTREFPFLLSKLSENDFKFSQCRFAKLNKGQKNHKEPKNGTARVFLYDLLRIPNVFTIENSYCSAKNSLFHYDKASYELIGGDILRAISLYFSPSFKQKVHTTNTPQYCEDEGKAEQQKVQKDIKHLGFSFSSLFASQQAQAKKKINFEQKYRDGQGQMTNVASLRQRYIDQLRLNDDNIKIGLMKDEGSESEDQERIFEVKQKKQKMRVTTPNRNKKHSNTAEKLMTYLHKTKKQPQPKKQKDHKSCQNHSILNMSKAHSQINLNKANKPVKYNRFYTISKAEQLIIVPDPQQQQPFQLPIKGFHSKRKRATTEKEVLNQKKKDHFLSIVDIGLTGKTNTTHNYRFNLAQKVNHKYQSKPLQQGDIIYEQRKYRGQNEMYLNRVREQEIKEYLRKLVRPKHILERRNKLANRQRNQKQEMRLKQSSIQFANGRLTRMLVHQEAASRLADKK